MARQNNNVSGRGAETMNERDDEDLGQRVSGNDTSSLYLRKIFVGGLSPQTRESGLTSYFSNFGVVSRVVVMTDIDNGRPRGFGFVTFHDSVAASHVLHNRYHWIDSRHVEVKLAIPRTSAPEASDQTEPSPMTLPQSRPREAPPPLPSPPMGVLPPPLPDGTDFTTYGMHAEEQTWCPPSGTAFDSVMTPAAMHIMHDHVSRQPMPHYQGMAPISPVQAPPSYQAVWPHHVEPHNSVMTPTPKWVAWQSTNLMGMPGAMPASSISHVQMVPPTMSDMPIAHGVTPPWATAHGATAYLPMTHRPMVHVSMLYGEIPHGAVVSGVMPATATPWSAGHAPMVTESTRMAMPTGISWAPSHRAGLPEATATPRTTGYGAMVPEVPTNWAVPEATMPWTPSHEAAAPTVGRAQTPMHQRLRATAPPLPPAVQTAHSRLETATDTNGLACAHQQSERCGPLASSNPALNGEGKPGRGTVHTCATAAANGAVTGNVASSAEHQSSTPNASASLSLASALAVMSIDDLPYELIVEIAARAPLRAFRSVMRFDAPRVAALRVQRYYRVWIGQYGRQLSAHELTVGDRVLLRPGGGKPPLIGTASANLKGQDKWKVRVVRTGAYIDAPIARIRRLDDWTDGPWRECVGRTTAIAAASAARGAAVGATLAALKTVNACHTSSATAALAVAAASAASSAAAAATAASSAVLSASDDYTSAANEDSATEAAQLLHVAQQIQEATNSASQISIEDMPKSGSYNNVMSAAATLAQAATAAEKAADEAAAATSAATAIDAVGTLPMTEATASVAVTVAENVAMAVKALARAPGPEAAGGIAAEINASNAAATAVAEVGVAGRALARSWNGALSSTSDQAVATASSVVQEAADGLSAASLNVLDSHSSR